MAEDDSFVEMSLPSDDLSGSSWGVVSEKGEEVISLGDSDDDVEEHQQHGDDSDFLIVDSDIADAVAENIFDTTIVTFNLPRSNNDDDDDRSEETTNSSYENFRLLDFRGIILSSWNDFVDQNSPKLEIALEMCKESFNSSCNFVVELSRESLLDLTSSKLQAATEMFKEWSNNAALCTPDADKIFGNLFIPYVLGAMITISMFIIILSLYIVILSLGLFGGRGSSNNNNIHLEQILELQQLEKHFDYTDASAFMKDFDLNVWSDSLNSNINFHHQETGFEWDFDLEVEFDVDVDNSSMHTTHSVARKTTRTYFKDPSLLNSKLGVVFAFLLEDMDILIYLKTSEICSGAFGASFWQSSVAKLNKYSSIKKLEDALDNMTLSVELSGPCKLHNLLNVSLWSATSCKSNGTESLQKRSNNGVKTSAKNITSHSLNRYWLGGLKPLKVGIPFWNSTAYDQSYKEKVLLDSSSSSSSSFRNPSASLSLIVDNVGKSLRNTTAFAHLLEDMDILEYLKTSQIRSKFQNSFWKLPRKNVEVAVKNNATLSLLEKVELPRSCKKSNDEHILRKPLCYFTRQAQQPSIWNNSTKNSSHNVSSKKSPSWEKVDWFSFLKPIQVKSLIVPSSWYNSTFYVPTYKTPSQKNTTGTATGGGAAAEGSPRASLGSFRNASASALYNIGKSVFLWNTTSAKNTMTSLSLWRYDSSSANTMRKQVSDRIKNLEMATLELMEFSSRLLNRPIVDTTKSRQQQQQQQQQKAVNVSASNSKNNMTMPSSTHQYKKKVANNNNNNNNKNKVRGLHKNNNEENLLLFTEEDWTYTANPAPRQIDMSMMKKVDVNDDENNSNDEYLKFTSEDWSYHLMRLSYQKRL